MQRSGAEGGGAGCSSGSRGGPRQPPLPTRRPPRGHRPAPRTGPVCHHLPSTPAPSTGSSAQQHPRLIHPPHAPSSTDSSTQHHPRLIQAQGLRAVGLRLGPVLELDVGRRSVGIHHRLPGLQVDGLGVGINRHCKGEREKFRCRAAARAVCEVGLASPWSELIHLAWRELGRERAGGRAEGRRSGLARCNLARRRPASGMRTSSRLRSASCGRPHSPSSAARRRRAPAH